MDITKFQNDLKNGITLSAALKKYNLTFKEAVELCPKPMKNTAMIKRKYRKNIIQRADKYIQQRSNRFYLRKQINKKMCSFGVYTSLKDAVLVRDYLIENGWNEKNMLKACEKYGIDRRGRKN